MTDTAKRLGYGGSAAIAGAQVLITSGSFDSSTSVSYLSMIDIKPDMTPRSSVKHADGTISFTGSLAFDVTEDAMGIFGAGSLLKRNYSFGVGIHDGENQYIMTGCKVTNIVLSGDAGGLVNASVSFMSENRKEIGAVSNAFIRDQTMIGYWWSGNTDVKSWTLNMTQDVQPVYANLNLGLPSRPLYLRVGLISYSLGVTTYSEINHSNIGIQTRGFTLNGDTTEKGYSYGGQTGLGEYSHMFTTSADATVGSDDSTVLLIT